jgi:beta-glucosidase-like glycosyl hydrolase
VIWLTEDIDWEGFGSDPVLQAYGGALSIEGIQSTGVIATIKHLIANEQEEYRMYNLVKPGISSNLDDRTLHELYLWPFAEGKLDFVYDNEFERAMLTNFEQAYGPVLVL